MNKISRRNLLKLAGAAPAVLVAPASTRGPAPAAPATSAVPASAQRALLTLSENEAALLDAIAERLIPSDTNGPGAREANAVRYIDRALSGALASSRETYRNGLAALERYARASRGRSFLDLTPTDQDSVLIDVESGTVTPGIFDGSSAQFFTMVRAHTWQGMFGDPYYGGNENFVGWDLLGYPGVRTYVSPEEQRLNVVVKPSHKSAYDDAMFNKATVKNRHNHGRHHGDKA
jgi:gluconate 2-dehydrogenase gamma chain